MDLNGLGISLMNTLAHRLSAPTLATVARSGADGFQEMVESGCVGARQSLPYPWIESEMAMAFHGVHQVGQRRLQAFSANSVGQLPRSRSPLP